MSALANSRNVSSASGGSPSGRSTSRATGAAPELPAWPRPDPAVFKSTVSLLEDLHGRVQRPGAKSRGGFANLPVLDALIHTILSQNTTGANSSRAFVNLQKTFGKRWLRVLEAPVEAVADSIRCGGLANVKARRIQTILREVQQTCGRLDLEHLRNMTDAQVKQMLTRFDGVGPKTASCVLLFCLGRDSFAVDTHVHRIARQLRWVPANASREKTYLHLDACVPDALKYRLHVLLIRHGQSCPACAANGRPQRAPRGPCPLTPLTPPT